MIDSELVDAIAVTAELTGTQLSTGAARVFSQDLAEYPLDGVLAALNRCRREVRGRLTLADVISRIDDGRPGVEEAWMALPYDEARSVVWTDEMCQASAGLLGSDDKIAARMAFKERYQALVRTARDRKLPVCWTPSLGHDRAGRESVLLAAVNEGKITLTHARRLAPELPAPDDRARIERGGGLKLIRDVGKGGAA